MVLEDHNPEEPFYNEYFEAGEFGFDTKEAAKAGMDNWLAENETLANYFVLYCRVYQGDETGLFGWEVQSEEFTFDEDADVVPDVRESE